MDYDGAKFRSSLYRFHSEWTALRTTFEDNKSYVRDGISRSFMKNTELDSTLGGFVVSIGINLIREKGRDEPRVAQFLSISYDNGTPIAYEFYEWEGLKTFGYRGDEETPEIPTDPSETHTIAFFTMTAPSLQTPRPLDCNIKIDAVNELFKKYVLVNETTVYDEDEIYLVIMISAMVLIGCLSEDDVESILQNKAFVQKYLIRPAVDPDADKNVGPDPEKTLETFGYTLCNHDSYNNQDWDKAMKWVDEWFSTIFLMGIKKNLDFYFVSSRRNLPPPKSSYPVSLTYLQSGKHGLTPLVQLYVTDDLKIVEVSTLGTDEWCRSKSQQSECDEEIMCKWDKEINQCFPDDASPNPDDRKKLMLSVISTNEADKKTWKDTLRDFLQVIERQPASRPLIQVKKYEKPDGVPVFTYSDDLMDRFDVTNTGSRKSAETIAYNDMTSFFYPGGPLPCFSHSESKNNQTPEKFNKSILFFRDDVLNSVFKRKAARIETTVNWYHVIRFCGKDQNHAKKVASIFKKNDMSQSKNEFLKHFLQYKKTPQDLANLEDIVKFEKLEVNMCAFYGHATGHASFADVGYWKGVFNILQLSQGIFLSTMTQDDLQKGFRDSVYSNTSLPPGNICFTSMERVCETFFPDFHDEVEYADTDSQQIDTITWKSDVLSPLSHTGMIHTAQDLVKIFIPDPQVKEVIMYDSDDRKVFYCSQDVRGNNPRVLQFYSLIEECRRQLKKKFTSFSINAIPVDTQDNDDDDTLKLRVFDNNMHRLSEFFCSRFIRDGNFAFPFQRTPLLDRFDPTFKTQNSIAERYISPNSYLEWFENGLLWYAHPRVGQSNNHCIDIGVCVSKYFVEASLFAHLYEPLANLNPRLKEMIDQGGCVDVKYAYEQLYPKNKELFFDDGKNSGFYRVKLVSFEEIIEEKNITANVLLEFQASLFSSEIVSKYHSALLRSDFNKSHFFSDISGDFEEVYYERLDSKGEPALQHKAWELCEDTFRKFVGNKKTRCVVGYTKVYNPLFFAGDAEKTKKDVQHMKISINYLIDLALASYCPMDYRSLVPFTSYDPRNTSRSGLVQQMRSVYDNTQTAPPSVFNYSELAKRRMMLSSWLTNIERAPGLDMSLENYMFCMIMSYIDSLTREKPDDILIFNSAPVFISTHITELFSIPFFNRGHSAPLNFADMNSMSEESFLRWVSNITEIRTPFHSKIDIVEVIDKGVYLSGAFFLEMNRLSLSDAKEESDLSSTRRGQRRGSNVGIVPFSYNKMVLISDLTSPYLTVDTAEIATNTDNSIPIFYDSYDILFLSLSRIVNIEVDSTTEKQYMVYKSNPLVLNTSIMMYMRNYMTAPIRASIPENNDIDGDVITTENAEPVYKAFPLTCSIQEIANIMRDCVFQDFDVVVPFSQTQNKDFLVRRATEFLKMYFSASQYYSTSEINRNGFFSKILDERSELAQGFLQYVIGNLGSNDFLVSFPLARGIIEKARSAVSQHFTAPTPIDNNETIRDLNLCALKKFKQHYNFVRRERTRICAFMNRIDVKVLWWKLVDNSAGASFKSLADFCVWARHLLHLPREMTEQELKDRVWAGVHMNSTKRATGGVLASEFVPDLSYVYEPSVDIVYIISPEKVKYLIKLIELREKYGDDFTGSVFVESNHTRQPELMEGDSVRIKVGTSPEDFKWSPETHKILSVTGDTCEVVTDGAVLSFGRKELLRVSTVYDYIATSGEITTEILEEYKKLSREGGDTQLLAASQHSEHYVMVNENNEPLFENVDGDGKLRLYVKLPSFFSDAERLRKSNFRDDHKTLYDGIVVCERYLIRPPAVSNSSRKTTVQVEIIDCQCCEPKHLPTGAKGGIPWCDPMQTFCVCNFDNNSMEKYFDDPSSLGSREADEDPRDILPGISFKTRGLPMEDMEDDINIARHPSAWFASVVSSILDCRRESCASSTGALMRTKRSLRHFLGPLSFDLPYSVFVEMNSALIYEALIAFKSVTPLVREATFIQDHLKDDDGHLQWVRPLKIRPTEKSRHNFEDETFELDVNTYNVLNKINKIEKQSTVKDSDSESDAGSMESIEKQDSRDDSDDSDDSDVEVLCELLDINNPWDNNSALTRFPLPEFFVKLESSDTNYIITKIEPLKGGQEMTLTPFDLDPSRERRGSFVELMKNFNSQALVGEPRLLTRFKELEDLDLDLRAPEHTGNLASVFMDSDTFENALHAASGLIALRVEVEGNEDFALVERGYRYNDRVAILCEFFGSDVPFHKYSTDGFLRSDASLLQTRTEYLNFRSENWDTHENYMGIASGGVLRKSFCDKIALRQLNEISSALVESGSMFLSQTWIDPSKRPMQGREWWVYEEDVSPSNMWVSVARGASALEADTIPSALEEEEIRAPHKWFSGALHPWMLKTNEKKTIKFIKNIGEGIGLAIDDAGDTCKLLSVLDDRWIFSKKKPSQMVSNANIPINLEEKTCERFLQFFLASGADTQKNKFRFFLSPPDLLLKSILSSPKNTTAHKDFQLAMNLCNLRLFSTTLPNSVLINMCDITRKYLLTCLSPGLFNSSPDEKSDEISNLIISPLLRANPESKNMNVYDLRLFANDALSSLVFRLCSSGFLGNFSENVSDNPDELRNLSSLIMGNLMDNFFCPRINENEMKRFLKSHLWTALGFSAFGDAQTRHLTCLGYTQFLNASDAHLSAIHKKMAEASSLAPSQEREIRRKESEICELAFQIKRAHTSTRVEKKMMMAMSGKISLSKKPNNSDELFYCQDYPSDLPFTFSREQHKFLLDFIGMSRGHSSLLIEDLLRRCHDNKKKTRTRPKDLDLFFDLFVRAGKKNKGQAKVYKEFSLLTKTSKNIEKSKAGFQKLETRLNENFQTKRYKEFVLSANELLTEENLVFDTENEKAEFLLMCLYIQYQNYLLWCSQLVFLRPSDEKNAQHISQTETDRVQQPQVLSLESLGAKAGGVGTISVDPIQFCELLYLLKLFEKDPKETIPEIDWEFIHGPLEHFVLNESLQKSIFLNAGRRKTLSVVDNLTQNTWLSLVYELRPDAGFFWSVAGMTSKADYRYQRQLTELLNLLHGRPLIFEAKEFGGNKTSLALLDATEIGFEKPTHVVANMSFFEADDDDSLFDLSHWVVRSRRQGSNRRMLNDDAPTLRHFDTELLDAKSREVLAIADVDADHSGHSIYLKKITPLGAKKVEEYDSPVQMVYKLSDTYSGCTLEPSNVYDRLDGLLKFSPDFLRLGSASIEEMLVDDKIRHSLKKDRGTEAQRDAYLAPSRFVSSSWLDRGIPQMCYSYFVENISLLTDSALKIFKKKPKEKKGEHNAVWKIKQEIDRMSQEFYDHVSLGNDIESQKIKKRFGLLRLWSERNYFIKGGFAHPNAIRAALDAYKINLVPLLQEFKFDFLIDKILKLSDQYKHIGLFQSHFKSDIVKKYIFHRVLRVQRLEFDLSHDKEEKLWSDQFGLPGKVERPDKAVALKSRDPDYPGRDEDYIYLDYLDKKAAWEAASDLLGSLSPTSHFESSTLSAETKKIFWSPDDSSQDDAEKCNPNFPGRYVVLGSPSQSLIVPQTNERKTKVVFLGFYRDGLASLVRDNNCTLMTDEKKCNQLNSECTWIACTSSCVPRPDDIDVSSQTRVLYHTKMYFDSNRDETIQIYQTGNFHAKAVFLVCRK